MTTALVQAYECTLETCDAGYHVEEPAAVPGVRIEARINTTLDETGLEEYADEDGEFYFVPDSAGIVEPTEAWEMACGCWYLTKPGTREVRRCLKCGHLWDPTDGWSEPCDCEEAA